MRILIVEDDKTTQIFLKDMIAMEGYEAITANDGVEGLEKFRLMKPDIIITDIQMPNMDGIELLRAVRSENEDVIVIITTGYGNNEYAVSAMELRANNFLKKPIRLGELFSLLSKYQNVIRDRTIEHEITGFFKNKSFVLQFGNDMNMISKIADKLMLETGNKIDPKEKLGIHLGLVELITNAIEHGNLGITYDETTAAVEKDGSTYSLVNERMQNPEFADRIVTVKFEMDENACEWIIEDEGRGFDWQSIPEPNRDDLIMLEHGRGIFLCRIQFDKVEFLGNGNKVRVMKKLC